MLCEQHSVPTAKCIQNVGPELVGFDDSCVSIMTVSAKLVYSRLYNMSPDPITREKCFAQWYILHE